MVEVVSHQFGSDGNIYTLLGLEVVVHNDESRAVEV